MRDGPEAGLRLIDAPLADGELDGYHLGHAARAEAISRQIRQRSRQLGQNTLRTARTRYSLYHWSLYGTNNRSSHVSSFPRPPEISSVAGTAEMNPRYKDFHVNH
jgi:hypothetical protein